MKHKSLILTLVLAAALSACSKKEQTPQPTEAPAPAPMSQSAPAPMAAPAAPAPMASGEDAAKTKYETVCATCHGTNGQGVAAFPKLTGMTADQIAAKLQDYKAGKQVGPQTAVMAPNAKNLSDDEIKALASYIAGLK
jgi:cytochrome c553